MTDKRNINSQQSLSDDALEALLEKAEFAEVPQYFANKVMQEIDGLPDAMPVESHSKSEWWQWAALIGGGIPALMQILAFAFSAWNIASLG